MPLPIQDYALIGDRQTAALVGTDGSIDWLCLPHFDSHACFAAILGRPEHGRWRIGPATEATTTRRYIDGSLVLETEHRTATGLVRITDAMPAHDDRADVVRIIEGLEGTVTLEHELVVRFGYGAIIPWVTRERVDGDDELHIVAGPDRLVLRGGPMPRGNDMAHRGTLEVAAGDRIVYDLCWSRSYREAPAPLDTTRHVAATVDESREWLTAITYDGPYADAVRTSVLVLRALTDAATGGIMAAPTTSLPEARGGERNWDYRFTWLRDAALTVEAMLLVGLTEKAVLWRDWLQRAIAGDAASMLIMYRRDGGRDMHERELPWLPGYADSRPVRVGNGAWDQRQLDTLGQALLALEAMRHAGIDETRESWSMQRAMLDGLAEHWREEDHGLWEMRGPTRRLTHSRVMVWVAFECGVRAIEEGCEGSAERWREIRDAVRREVLTDCWNDEIESFTQSPDTEEVDASLLLLVSVGFLEPDDPRFAATIRRIERELMVDGLLLRYRTESGRDGLAGDEHPFLICSFWLVVAYAQVGRLDDADALMARLVALRSDVGLMAEEYDPATGDHLGNFPQAFSHLGLVRAAAVLERAHRGVPATQRTPERPPTDVA